MEDMATSSGDRRMRSQRQYLLGLVVCCLVSFGRCMAFGIGRQQREARKARRMSEEPCRHQQGESFILSRHDLIHSAISSITAVSVLATTALPSNALSPEAASSAYDTYASSYDELDGGAASTLLGLDEARSQIFSKARGKVLEIGVGTGLNLSKYSTEQVRSLTVADISEGMLQEAKTRVKALKLPFPVDFVKADATSQLADLFGENAFDTVVDSFSLCVMGNEGAKRCLSQLTQVVKTQADGGRVLLLENSRSSNPAFGLYQDITADAAASAGGKGCVYNQDVGKLIKSTRRLMIQQETSYVAGLFRAYECTKTT